MPTEPTPTERLNAIVEQGLCIGCGLCQSIAGPETIAVVRTTEGYQQPVVVGDLQHDTVDTIYDVCPGTRVDGLPADAVAADTKIDPVWGPWRRIVRAWAGDPEVRHVGSTGGVLTAVAQHLLRTDQVDFVLHVKASSTEPTFGEATRSFTEAEVLAAAGSRYGPTAPLLDIASVLDRDQPFAFIGKPCDIAALRNHARHDDRVDTMVKFWLTPVCGGFGTPRFTEGFLERNGIEPSEVTSFRYRGHGCPGPTRVETADRVVERHYLDYWGTDASQWSLPWRCKICPDGIGEGADLAISDTWPGGSPDREESLTDLGVNAVVARTTAGQTLLEEAEAAGALVLDGELGPADMTAMQPHQMRKKFAVADRHLALGQAERIVPLTHRLRIHALADELPVDVRRAQRQGTLDRIAAGKATEPTPSVADQSMGS